MEQAVAGFYLHQRSEGVRAAGNHGTIRVLSTVEGRGQARRVPGLGVTRWAAGLPTRSGGSLGFSQALPPNQQLHR